MSLTEVVSWNVYFVVLFFHCFSRTFFAGQLEELEYPHEPSMYVIFTCIWETLTETCR